MKPTSDGRLGSLVHLPVWAARPRHRSQSPPSPSPVLKLPSQVPRAGVTAMLATGRVVCELLSKQTGPYIW